jgi:orotate phosphoribosyltransferase
MPDLEEELLNITIDDRGKELGALLLKSECIRISRIDLARGEKAEKVFNKRCDIDFSKIINNAELKEEIGSRVADKLYDIYKGKATEKFDCLYGIPTWGELITDYVRNKLEGLWKIKTNVAIYKNPPGSSQPEITRFSENDKRAVVIDDSLITGESLIKYCRAYLNSVKDGEIAGIIVLVDAGLWHDKDTKVKDYVERELKTKVYPIATLDGIVQEFVGKTINGENHKVVTMNVETLQKREETQPYIKVIDAKAYEEDRNEYLKEFNRKIYIKKPAVTPILESYPDEKPKPQ